MAPVLAHFSFDFTFRSPETQTVNGVKVTRNVKKRSSKNFA